MELYLNSVGVISGAGNNMSDGFLMQAPEYTTDFLPADEPEYKTYISPMQLRRMSRAVRMGVVAARVAMDKAGIEKPDALSLGTAYGCLQDTEKFLDKMISQDEQMLTPTAFIQSTHNTVGGQIALLAGCNGHNMTYVHRGHSFEHAMINAALYLQDHTSETMLVGGIDEHTPNSIKALQVAGHYTTKEVATDDVVQGNNITAVGSEGAAFFTVSQKPKSDKYVCVKAIEVFDANEKTALHKVQEFANRHTGMDIDLVLLGSNGTNNTFYNTIKNEVYPNASAAMFKHCSGDYPVASAFALSVLHHAANQSTLPQYFYTDKKNEKIKNVVLINNFCSSYSCWLLALPV